jgi:hypothetical protein
MQPRLALPLSPQPYRFLEGTLSRLAPERSTVPHELAGTIQDLRQHDARDLLATFYGHGFLTAVSRESFRYQPNSPELARGLAALAKAYAERRIAILEQLARLAGLDPVRSLASTRPTCRRRGFS